MADRWIKKYVKEMDNGIWQMPPLYYKVWCWILYEVDRNTGSMRTSIRQIAEGVSWVEYSTERIPNKKTISKVLDYLESNGMIFKESNAHFTEITAINWDTYQLKPDEKVTGKTKRIGKPSTQPDGQPDTHRTRSTAVHDSKESCKDANASKVDPDKEKRRIEMREVLAEYVRVSGVDSSSNDGKAVWPKYRKYGKDRLMGAIACLEQVLKDPNQVQFYGYKAPGKWFRSNVDEWVAKAENGFADSSSSNRLDEFTSLSCPTPGCKGLLLGRRYPEGSGRCPPNLQGKPIYECPGCGYKRLREYA